MGDRAHQCVAVLSTLVVAAVASSASAAVLHVGRHHRISLSLLPDYSSARLVNPAGNSPWNLPGQAALAPPARSFAGALPPSLGDPFDRSQAGMRSLARYVHWQRARLVGINGADPIAPMSAVELGGRISFGDDRLVIAADVFRYRSSRYRGAGLSSLFPLVGMAASTRGGELNLVYKLSSRDSAGLNASYSGGHRSSLLTLGIAGSRRVNVRSLQLIPSLEHVVPLRNGQFLSFDAAAIFRSSMREIEAIGPQASLIRRSNGTRFDFSMTYRLRPRFFVSAFVRNLTDVRPDRSMAFTTSTILNPPTVSAVLAEPRTYGLSLSARLR